MNSFLLFILLCLIASLLCYFHYKENSKTAKLIAIKEQNIILVWINRLQNTRTLYLIILLTSYSLIIAAYNWQLRSTQENLRIIPTLQEEIKNKDILLSNITPALEELKQQISAKNIPTSTTTSTQTRRKPIHDDYSLQGVYNPEEGLSGKQPAMDALKKRYEEILVTHFFLQKCNLASQTNYHIIISSLSQEMASINAPGRLQYDIVTAAQGSYKEVYAQSNCNGENIPNLQSQYSEYIKSLVQNVPK